MAQLTNKHIHKDSISYKIFTVLAYSAILIWASACILPFAHMIAISVSSKEYADAMLVGIWPRGFTLSNYGKAFTDSQILSSLSMSLKRTLLGVFIELFVTVLAAYPLSKDKLEFPSRGLFSLLFIICMIFNGGLVPTYILVSSDLKLTNSVFSLILPNAVNIGNLILLLNFFRQIPRDIEEAAEIDGASYPGRLMKIVLPLSLNALLTLVLFISIGHWNSWFDGMIYMKEASRYPLSTYLYIIRNRISQIRTQEDARLVLNFSQQGMIMTYAVICILPVMILYPMLQRYVKKGLIIGSVKG